VSADPTAIVAVGWESSIVRGLILIVFSLKRFPEFPDQKRGETETFFTQVLTPLPARVG